MCACVLIGIVTLFSAYNFFNGFAEDTDSLRIMQAAAASKKLHSLVASRSWGFPLYEVFVYNFLNYATHGVFICKFFSFAFICFSVLLLFRILKDELVPSGLNLGLCIVFLANPVIIIASNSLMETSMSLFFLTLLLHFVALATRQSDFGILTYILYGLFVAMATLVRPDNLIYFPSLFILLFLRKKLDYKKVFLSVFVLFFVGILPYFLLGYPIFHRLPSIVKNPLFFGAKNILALLGVPTFLMLLVFAFIFNRKYFCFRKEASDFVHYLFILLGLVLFRFVLLADEIEYGILIWIILIILSATFLRQQFLASSPRNIYLFLLFFGVATITPNFVQIFFFKENNFEYEFALGITNGVLKQEKERRIFNQTVWEKGTRLLIKASNSIARKDLKLSKSINYNNCDSCLVLTTVRDLKVEKELGGKGTDVSRQRFVFCPQFNVSRGWRNFIQDDSMPVLTEKELVINY